MTIYQTVKGKLESHPHFRERRFRGPYLAILTLRSMNLEEKQKAGAGFSLEELSEYGIKYGSFERVWRDVLKDHEELQGSDYEDKVALEQEAQSGLGYEPGHHQDVSKLKQMFDE